nr:MAG TPA: hypothetical protein [Caudoviricetes sp.]
MIKGIANSKISPIFAMRNTMINHHRRATDNAHNIL